MLDDMLTETGQAAFARLRDTAIAFDAKLRAGLADADLATLSTLLGHLAAKAASSASSNGLSALGRDQAGYWSWRAHTSIQSSRVMVRPDERMPASSVKYSSRGGPGANRMSIRAGAPLSLAKA